MPSITIFKQPGYYQPLANQLDYIITSADINLPGWRYYMDVLVATKDINGFTTTFNKVERLIASARPSDGNGEFTPHRVLQAYCTPESKVNINNVHYDTTNAVAYKCNFGFGWNPQLTYGISGVSSGAFRGNTITPGADWTAAKKPQGAVYNPVVTYYYLRIKTNTAHTLAIGDEINISKNRKGYNSHYEGKCKVRGIYLTGGVIDTIEVDVIWSAKNWNGLGDPDGSATTIAGYNEIGEIIDSIRISLTAVEELVTLWGTRQLSEHSKNWYQTSYNPLNIATYNDSGWLTNWEHSNKYKKIYKDQLETISFLYYGGLVVDSYRIRVYDKNMVELGTRYVDFTSSIDIDTKNFHWFSLQVGYDKVMSQAIPDATNIFPTAKYYTVTIGQGNAGPSNQYGITAKYEIVDRDCWFDNVRICFLNRKGGYEYFNFSKNSERKQNTTRTEWTQNLAYDSTQESRSRTVLTTKIEESFTANTDYLTYDEYLFLEELISSPDVYSVTEEGVMIPIILTSNDYQAPSKFYEEKVLTIEYKNSNKINIQ